MVPSGRRPQTIPNDPGCESSCRLPVGCQKPHPPSPSVIITHSVRITWKPDYAGPPHLFSLPHSANAVAEYLGTEGLHTYFSVIWLMITQSESWYSFYHPTEDRRLSRPRHCSKSVQPMPKAVYRSGFYEKCYCPRWDSNLGPLTPQSGTLWTFVVVVCGSCCSCSWTVKAWVGCLHSERVEPSRGWNACCQRTRQETAGRGEKVDKPEGFGHRATTESTACTLCYILLLLSSNGCMLVSK